MSAKSLEQNLLGAVLSELEKNTRDSLKTANAQVPQIEKLLRELDAAAAAPNMTNKAMSEKVDAVLRRIKRVNIALAQREAERRNLARRAEVRSAYLDAYPKSIDASRRTLTGVVEEESKPVDNKSGSSSSRPPNTRSLSLSASTSLLSSTSSPSRHSIPLSLSTFSALSRTRTTPSRSASVSAAGTSSAAGAGAGAAGTSLAGASMSRLAQFVAEARAVDAERRRSSSRGVGRGASASSSSSASPSVQSSSPIQTNTASSSSSSSSSVKGGNKAKKRKTSSSSSSASASASSSSLSASASASSSASPNDEDGDTDMKDGSSLAAGSGPPQLPLSTDPRLNAHGAQRMSLMMVDHMLRSGYFKSGTMLAHELGLEDFVDTKLHAQLRLIMDDLDQHQCAKALEFCRKNQKKLKTLESTLEQHLHEQQFIELIRSGHARRGESADTSDKQANSENTDSQNSSVPEAYKYAQKYFAERINVPSSAASSSAQDAANGAAANGAPPPPAAAAEDAEATASLERVKELFMCLLVYDTKTGKCQTEKHKKYFDMSRWDDLRKEFFGDYFRVYDTTAHSTLELVLKSGLGRIMTNKCGHDTNNDCPACWSQMAPLRQAMKPSRRSNSTLICRISGTPMDENNVPMRTPHGEVYGRKSLQSFPDTTKIECPKTKEVFSLANCKQIFIYN